MFLTKISMVYLRRIILKHVIKLFLVVARKIADFCIGTNFDHLLRPILNFYSYGFTIYGLGESRMDKS